MERWWKYTSSLRTRHIVFNKIRWTWLLIAGGAIFLFTCAPSNGLQEQSRRGWTASGFNRRKWHPVPEGVINENLFRDEGNHSWTAKTSHSWKDEMRALIAVLRKCNRRCITRDTKKADDYMSSGYYNTALIMAILLSWFLPWIIKNRWPTTNWITGSPRLAAHHLYQ